MKQKSYSESELKELAKDVFEQFPDAKEVFATSDGNVFLNENRANLHAGKKGTVYPFTREEKQEVPEKPELSAKDSIAAISKVTSLEELEAFKADERKSVKEAYEKKALKLAKPQE